MVNIIATVERERTAKFHGIWLTYIMAHVDRNEVDAHGKFAKELLIILE